MCESHVVSTQIYDFDAWNVSPRADDLNSITFFLLVTMDNLKVRAKQILEIQQLSPYLICLAKK